MMMMIGRADSHDEARGGSHHARHIHSEDDLNCYTLEQLSMITDGSA
jgi:hypothetical protein